VTALVVKLGGSLAGDPRLDVWGRLFAAATRPLLIVPGGGSFADAVRHAQPETGFSDRAAHRMAILAMAQYGEALADRFRLPVVATESDVAALRGAAVWSPLATALDDPRLPATWDLTSDSIAAWLAAAIRAPGLLLECSAQRTTRRRQVSPIRCFRLTRNSFPARCGSLDPKARKPWQRWWLANRQRRRASCGWRRRRPCGGRCDGQETRNAALGLGADRLRALLHRMPRHHAAARKPRRVRVEGGG
jgi:hypothetical protein